jgi:putative endopeptidase
MRRWLLALPLTLALASGAQAAPAWDRADLDTTCAPCRDFYRFASGGWLDRTKMPAGYGEYGSFDALSVHNEEVLRGLLEKASANPSAAPGSDERRVGDYYATCLDSVRAEREGLEPLRTELTGIEGIASTRDLMAQIGWLHAGGVRSGFAFGAGPDPRRSSLTIASTGQGGLGLPDRDYYFRADTASQALRAAYVEHVARILKLLGRPDPAAEAAAVMALETRLAEASMTNVQRRDPRATYHKVPLDSLRAWTPGVAWDDYFARRAMRAPDSINVMQPVFLKAFSGALASVPLADWRAYLRWQMVHANAGMLSQAFVDEDFAFRRRLTGATELRPRWKRCIAATDGDLGDLLGRMYVRDNFPPKARERALAMVKRLEAALGDRIAGLGWMSDSTRLAAKVKLAAFGEKIGYPDTWKDYAGVKIGRDSWLTNSRATTRWEIERSIRKIGGPVDKREWGMSPPTVNAFYSPPFNTINFPAGILQAPFYDPSWDDALNYGAIGAVIGHEMTHGFDDRGRQYDADGNLRDWWTAGDASRYRERAERVTAQFDAIVVLDSLHVNGRLTLGENIADLGGLAVAYAAFQKAQLGQPRRIIDGFTPEQRFFLSWARVWRTLQSDPSLRTQVANDPHSPPAARVNGPFSNLEEFAKAWGCKAGDPMVRKPADRIAIW